MQTKFLAQVILKIFSAKMDLASAKCLLMLLVPRHEDHEGAPSRSLEYMQSMVLNKSMATAIMTLDAMCSIDITAQELSEAANLIVCENISSCHRPWARLTQISQYKRLVQSVRHTLSVRELDAHAKETAKNVDAALKDIDQTQALLQTSLNEGTLTALRVMHTLESIVSVKALVCGLPANEDSEYATLRCSKLAFVDQDTDRRDRHDMTYWARAQGPKPNHTGLHHAVLTLKLYLMTYDFVTHDSLMTYDQCR